MPELVKRKLKDLPTSRSRIKTVGQDPLNMAVSGIPLSQSHPALALELIDKGPYSADDIVAGSNRVMLWRHGRCGQEIRVSVAVRARAWDEGSAYQGCYICAGREPQIREPKVIPKWLQEQCLPDKSKSIKIKDISPSSQTYRQYKCPSGTGKVFSSRISDRVNNTDGSEKQGCPCAKCYKGERRNLSTEKASGLDLEAMYIRTEENLGFDPGKLPFTYRVRWRCQENKTHLFSRSLEELYESGCPSCRKQNEDNTLAAEPYRQILRELLFVRGFPELSPGGIKAGSHLVAAFRCTAGHTFEKAIYRRTQKIGPENCPYCAGKRSNAPSLFSLFPYLLKRWHPEKNVVIDKETGETLQIEPDTILADSRKKHWFICHSGHCYQASAVEVAENSDRCQSCAILPNCVDNVRPEITEQWHGKRNGELTPWNTAAGSAKPVWWRCKAGPDHEWQAKVYKRALEKNGCPFCANKRLSITNTLEAKYPELANLMLPEDNGGLKASEVIAVMTTALNWRCSCSSIYRRMIRYMVSDGPGCHQCRTETGL